MDKNSFTIKELMEEEPTPPEVEAVQDLVCGLKYFNRVKNKDFIKTPQTKIRYIVYDDLTIVVSGIKTLYHLYKKKNKSITGGGTFYEMIKNIYKKINFKNKKPYDLFNGKIFCRVFSNQNIKKKKINKLIYEFLSKVLTLNNNKNFDQILNNISRFNKDSTPLENYIYELLLLQEKQRKSRGTNL